jgi:hypothetical protein
MQRPVNDTALLQDLFSPRNAGRAYRVTFTGGEVYDLSGVLAAQDRDEPPHADGMILRVHRGKVGPGAALFFTLADVTRVTDLATEAELFSAGEPSG